MGNLLYIVAVVLLLLWVLGYFAFSAGSLIHVLLVLALVAVIIRVASGRKNTI
ncbi:MAG TPA: lmo0937 family membrane protein [Chitinophagaceae bacterium]|nr:lmo0937 family membrane protein [Chitinophagaceae bacterium]